MKLTKTTFSISLIVFLLLAFIYLYLIDTPYRTRQLMNSVEENQHDSLYDQYEEQISEEQHKELQNINSTKEIPSVSEGISVEDYNTSNIPFTIGERRQYTIYSNIEIKKDGVTVSKNNNTKFDALLIFESIQQKNNNDIFSIRQIIKQGTTTLENKLFQINADGTLLNPSDCIYCEQIFNDEIIDKLKIPENLFVGHEWSDTIESPLPSLPGQSSIDQPAISVNMNHRVIHIQDKIEGTYVVIESNVNSNNVIATLEGKVRSEYILETNKMIRVETNMKTISTLSQNLEIIQNTIIELQ